MPRRLGDRQARPRLQERREELALTRREVADRAGHRPKFLGQLERGERYASVQIQATLAAIMELPVDELFEAADQGPLEARRDRVVAAYVDEPERVSSAAALARKLGLSPAIVCADLRARGVDLRPPVRPIPWAGQQRSPEVRARISATKAKAREQWAVEVPRGGCKTPGCPDRDCTISYGECHCRCGEAAPLAKQSDRKHQRVKGEPMLYRQGHNRTGGTLMAAEEGEPLMQAIERAEFTEREVALRAGLSEGVVSALIDIVGYRLRRDRCDRIVRVLCEEHERRGLDTAGLTLGSLFTHELPVDEPVGDRRHRTVRRRPALPPAERYDGRHFTHASETAEAELAKLGKWSHAETTVYLRRSSAGTSYLRATKVLTAEQLKIGPLRVTAYDARLVKMAARQLILAPNEWRKHYLDPIWYFDWLRQCGVSRERAHELVALLDERQEHKRIRVGTGAGRPPSAGPPAYHYEWAQMFEALAPEPRTHSCDYGECQRSAKTRLRVDSEVLGHYCEAHAREFQPETIERLPPSNRHAALIVARCDYREHREDIARWPYDPDDFPEEAAKRVLEAVKGVKALQIGGTEIRAL